MEINKVLQEVLFNEEGNFCRIDIPIRVIGAHSYLCGKLHPIWWRLQYAKLLLRFHEKEFTEDEWRSKAMNQKKRLIYSIVTEKNGGCVDPILIGKNGALIDGAHRLAAAIVFERKEIPVKYTEEIGYYPQKEDCLIKGLYVREELNLIESFKVLILRRYNLCGKN